jgi:molybdate transport system regulatory protein
MGASPHLSGLARPQGCGNPSGMVDTPVTLRLRLLFGDRLVFGPGKGELLSRIPGAVGGGGGGGGGGAVLSEDGQAVLAAYREILAAVDSAAAPGVARIAALLGDMSGRK